MIPATQAKRLSDETRISGIFVRMLSCNRLMRDTSKQARRKSVIILMTRTYQPHCMTSHEVLIEVEHSDLAECLHAETSGTTCADGQRA